MTAEQLKMTPEQLEASNLLTRTFMRLISRMSIIRSFRIIAFLGAQYAGPELQKRSFSFEGKLAYDPQFEELFTNREGFFQKIGGREGLAQVMTAKNLEDYKKATDAASLVFIHSILDDASLEYCRVTAIISPKDWEKFIIKKQIPLEEMKSTTPEEIFKTKLNEYLDGLEKQSVLQKVDRLFELCQPPDDFSQIRNYKYDRDRLKELDALRHNIVHGDGPVKELPNAEEDIEFLENTILHLLTLLNHKYHVQVNPWFLLMTSP